MRFLSQPPMLQRCMQRVQYTSVHPFKFSFATHSLNTARKKPHTPKLYISYLYVCNVCTYVHLCLKQKSFILSASISFAYSFTYINEYLYTKNKEIKRFSICAWATQWQHLRPHNECMLLNAFCKSIKCYFCNNTRNNE